MTPTPDELASLRSQLVERRQRLLAQLDYMENSFRTSLRDAAGGRGGYSTHEADEGTDHAERETAAQLTAAEMRLLESIDDALSRISKGNYGVCEDCGASINLRRLLAKPDATRCINCQEKRERADRDGRA